MSKVIIADDEKKVCQLIYMLVDWKEFDMEVAAIVNNGIEVLEQVREHAPDLIITDIRMPGLNGLEMIEQVKAADNTIEFIIISGYRHFEYAQTAIKFGVNDYLLKPIKKEDLVSTLSKMQIKLQEKNDLRKGREQLKKDLESNKVKLRKGLFTDILFTGVITGVMNKTNLTIDKINSEYNYNFQKGYFQTVCLKLDHVRLLNYGNTSILEEKTVDLLKKILRPVCHDFGVYFDNNTVFCILNYAPEQVKEIRKLLKTVIDENILQDAIYQQLEVTIGLGSPVTDVTYLMESFKKSDYALQQRLFLGTGKVLEFEAETGENLADSPIFYDFNRNFTAALNNLDLAAVIKDLETLKRNLLKRAETTGHEILQMTKEVCNVYLLSMRANKAVVSNADHFINDFNEAAGDCSSVQELFKLLNKTISESLNKVIEDRKQVNIKPIRMAKQYIENNYMKSISLDEVSAHVGFNATYFSTLFKKETGNTFLEYLSSVRMNQSKELLKETNKSIVTICEEVGYSDIKYFTKSFKKFTGLKPNEYRKLYS